MHDGLSVVGVDETSVLCVYDSTYRRDGHARQVDCGNNSRCAAAYLRVAINIVFEKLQQQLTLARRMEQLFPVVVV